MSIPPKSQISPWQQQSRVSTQAFNIWTNFFDYLKPHHSTINKKVITHSHIYTTSMIIPDQKQYHGTYYNNEHRYIQSTHAISKGCIKLCMHSVNAKEIFLFRIETVTFCKPFIVHINGAFWEGWIKSSDTECPNFTILHRTEQAVKHVPPNDFPIALFKPELDSSNITEMKEHLPCLELEELC